MKAFFVLLVIIVIFGMAMAGGGGHRYRTDKDGHRIPAHAKTVPDDHSSGGGIFGFAAGVVNDVGGVVNDVVSGVLG